MTQYELQPHKSEVGGEREFGRPVRFSGDQLATHSTKKLHDARWSEWTIYRTKGGSFVLETTHQTMWQGETSSKTVIAFASLDLLPDDVPQGLVIDAELALGIDPAIEIE